MFKKKSGITLTHKLIAGYSVLLALFAVVSGLHLYRLGSLKDSFREQSVQEQRTRLAYELKQKVQEMNILLSGYLVGRDQKLIASYSARADEMKSLIEQVGATALTKEERDWRARLTMTGEEYANMMALAETQLGHAQADSYVTILRHIHEGAQTHQETVFELVDRFIESYEANSTAAAAATLMQVEATEKQAVVAPLLALLLAAAIAAVMIRSYMKPIRRLQQAVGRLAEGDLRHRIGSSSNDELGLLSQQFDRMVENFSEMLRHTQRIAAALTTQAESFGRFSRTTAEANADTIRAIGEIAAGSDRQANEAERSHSCMLELDSRMKDIGRLAQTMMELSRDASCKSLDGAEAVDRLREASRQSGEWMEKLDEALDSLAANSHQTHKIVQAVTEISSQTHVLALNAAIEAARAGAHGRGFAVIAEEVRKLAQETHDSSKTIAANLGALVDGIVSSRRLMKQLSDSGLRLNEQLEMTARSFAEIEQSMRLILGRIETAAGQVAEAERQNRELLAASEQVAAIAEEMAAGVQEVNASSVRQDASIRDIARQSQEMAQLAHQLFEEIRRFRLAEEASGGDAGGEESERNRPTAEEAEARLREETPDAGDAAPQQAEPGKAAASNPDSKPPADAASPREDRSGARTESAEKQPVLL
ncbi:methyl-accepting chemotaxis protein [Paenibacillus thermoaerophilus]|uniref:Methyl-accepting chemotaxis protein n=1 Tax=Paenibacillus thermoaerophilus TaxID=1215385 RepID=A0ABW2UYZ9_9BACL|nr:methyl-accepting chemotaxis protein [Paenibacillus thermoaerophilus]TMV15985.1 methyl-accepting chemotaxis protein [Paenibacillus thermoaerophilus]